MKAREHFPYQPSDPDDSSLKSERNLLATLFYPSLLDEEGEVLSSSSWESLQEMQIPTAA